MNKINIKGCTPETIAGICILLAALINAVLQMFGVNTLPLENSNLSDIISTIFLFAATFWNTWKNRNFTTASQISQNITDAIKQGEFPDVDITRIIEMTKNE